MQHMSRRDLAAKRNKGDNLKKINKMLFLMSERYLSRPKYRARRKNFCW